MKYKIDSQGSNESNIIKQAFVLTTGLDGAPALHLNITLNLENSRFNGTAHISQAINPPPSFSSVVSGECFTVLTQGAPTTYYSGQGYLLNTPLYENLFFTFEVGGSNSARFRYKESIDSEWTVIENAKVVEDK